MAKKMTYKLASSLLRRFSSAFAAEKQAATVLLYSTT